jgi:phosphoglycolate phosphatase-like HAD superfamily hydrolase
MLFLFDIDGTLLRRAGQAHRQALEDAVRIVTGRQTSTDGIPVQGMLDRDILARMLAAAGAPPKEIRASLNPVMKKAQALYVRRCPDLRGKVCPGVRPFLAGLRRRGLPAGLVTGNLTRIAWTKMRRAGLREFFQLGAFADMGPTRTALAALAARQARAAGLLRRGEPVVLVGDHPNDIEAARNNRFFSIAVATGVVPYEELDRHRPHLLLPDLRARTLHTIVEQVRSAAL